MLQNFIYMVDNFFTRTFDIKYLRLVRSPLIHERAQYLVARIHRLQGVGLRVLDVGCGSAIPLFYLDRFCRQKISNYVGIDLHTEKLKKRHQTVKISHQFYNVNLDDDWHLGTFDVVCCFEVIEHIMNDDRLFSMLCAHVDQNGYLLLTAPSKEFVMKMAKYAPGFDKVSPVQDGGHVRMGYTMQDFQSLAEHNGMRILSCDRVSQFDVYDLKAYLSKRGVGGTLLYNLRYRRREEAVKFQLDGCPNGMQDTYYCIAACFVKEERKLDKLGDASDG